MNLDRAKTYGRLALRLLGVAAVVGGVLALGLLGWQWQASATVSHVSVTGTKHAPADTVRKLARVDSGIVMDEIDPALVADRVERHPWVERADVSKQRVRRTLSIVVTERTPAGLVLDAQGRPAYYLDASGHAMPLPDSTGYDVPLVRGLEAEYHPVRRLAPPSLHQVLSGLSTVGADGLVAEVELQPDSTVRLLTEPVGDHGSLPVQLGSGNATAKLRTLRAFAQQVLAAQPDAPIAQIDLRFDDQVITREHSLDG